MKILKIICLYLALSIQVLFAAVELTGSGATFPYPLYSKMFFEYNKLNNVKVNFQATGSGAGIKQLRQGIIDFAATDAFISDYISKRIFQDKEIIHVPICVGAVSIVVNLPGIKTINLNSEILSKIYRGQILKWSDEEIKRINNNLDIPDIPIIPIRRADSSGTTFIFTEFLSKTDAPWKNLVGRGKTVKWSTGIAGKGNAGLALLVNQIPGAIGYVSSIYAIQNELKAASVQNGSGNYISPTLTSISNATNSTTIPEDTRVSLTNPDAKNAYPICGLTWILIYEDQNYNNRTYSQAKETTQLIKWMINDGQEYAKALNYSPLTQSIIKKAETNLKKVHYNGKPL